MAGDGFGWAPLPPGPFDVIYADPPWAFRQWSKKDAVPSRKTQAPYQTMSIEAIKGLPVPEVTAKHATLFLWVVGSHLDQGIDVLRSWGFRYATDAFVWVKTDKRGKPKMSFGKWTRKEAEICLLGTKGDPSPRKGSRNVRQVLLQPPREHSRKPDDFRYRIERLAPGDRRLELFCRDAPPGWTAWGNDAGRFPVHGLAKPGR